MAATKTKSNASSKTKSKAKTVEETYLMKDPRQHVLDLPDTYVGGVDEDEHNMWVLDRSDDELRMVQKTITFVPAMFKIFDEIIVNARDQSIKDSTCKEIKVDINQETGMISCMNDGNSGIPVAMHKEHNMYVPEMIFSKLLTSGNYDQKGKTWGGKNGYGAKLANIFSTEFHIDVVGHDPSKGKKKLYRYQQKFSANMSVRGEEVITEVGGKAKPYCKISFVPDFKRFGVKRLNDDTVQLFEKRVYDIAALTRENLKVYLNGDKIKINNFESYISMFYRKGEDTKPHVYSVVNDRWKVGVLYNPDAGFRQISYVNGISTSKGGTHVAHVVDQIVSALSEHIILKNKGLTVKNAHIKDNLTVFIDSVIEDPSFNSQTKVDLASKLSKFGSRCNISIKDKFIQDLAKTGIVDEVVNFAKLKAAAALSKTDGKKTKRVKEAKLDDAGEAGGRKSARCRLILTEGDSAKVYADAGTEVIGKDFYGVFPLKGKLLNVREATADQLLKNKEIISIKNAMGLKNGKKYTDVSQLRYGGIIILTDEDKDGAHIKGLIMNFVHYFWPSLAKTKGFIQSIATPILKAWKKSDTKKKNMKIFYTESEYKLWKKSLSSTASALWTSKYYKGLGTSTDKEAIEVFKEFDERIITYTWPEGDKKKKEADEVSTASDKSDGDYETDKTNKCFDAITLAFSKNRADDRKRWLRGYDKNDIIENSETTVTFDRFVHKSLIHFSNYSCIRGLPSVCDGLKPGQRKIEYITMMRKFLTKEIKVAQLSGYVSAEAGYAHGEESLNGTIIKMAQNFVGSNNINLLCPNGNFGNRCKGGANASSPRYIYTQLNSLTPKIFRKEDECVLTYVNDDGERLEPERFLPIIPIVLVNGANGIATGFSTTVPSFNPTDIIANLKLMLKGKDPKSMVPWYRGFTGTIEKNGASTFKTTGIYKIVDNKTIHISELPIGTWTDKYKNILEDMVVEDKKNPKEREILEDVKSNSGTKSISFTLTFMKGELQRMIKSGSILKELKLTSSLCVSNMYLYNSKSVITKYNNVTEIMRDYYTDRLAMYVLRKEHYLKILQNQINLIKWKIKFIKNVISGEIEMMKNKRSVSKLTVIAKLEELKFPKLHTNVRADESLKSFSYITGLSLFSLTEEEIEKLENEMNNKEEECDIYKKTTVQELWLGELDEFSKAYKIWLEEEAADDDDDDVEYDAKGKKIRKSKSKTKKSK